LQYTVNGAHVHEYPCKDMKDRPRVSFRIDDYALSIVGDEFLLQLLKAGSEQLHPDHRVPSSSSWVRKASLLIQPTVRPESWLPQRVDS